MRCCKRQRGFTLIEVLIALMVISISLVAIAGEMISMLNAANTMQERTYASWIAQNKIAELRLANVVPEAGSSSGETNYANVDWSWRAVVEETGVENLFRVDVTVSLAGTDYDVRTVTGFIGTPVAPGQANLIWGSGAPSQGVEN